MKLSSSRALEWIVEEGNEEQRTAITGDVRDEAEQVCQLYGIKFPKIPQDDTPAAENMVSPPVGNSTGETTDPAIPNDMGIITKDESKQNAPKNEVVGPSQDTNGTDVEPTTEKSNSTNVPKPGTEKALSSSVSKTSVKAKPSESPKEDASESFIKLESSDTSGPGTLSSHDEGVMSVSSRKESIVLVEPSSGNNSDSSRKRKRGGEQVGNDLDPAQSTDEKVDSKKH